MQQPAIHLRQFPATVTFQIESIRRGGFRHILELYAGAITGHDLFYFTFLHQMFKLTVNCRKAYRCSILLASSVDFLCGNGPAGVPRQILQYLLALFGLIRTCRDNFKMILSRLAPYNIRLYNMRGNMQDIYSFFTHFATFRTACSKLTTGV